MSEKITVFVTTWRIPFSQTVDDVQTFDSVEAATAFINRLSAKWWHLNEGDRYVEEYPATEPYQPVEKLGYEDAHYEVWGGEAGFHAMLDEATQFRLHEAHYKREFDAKGIARPGYLQVAEAYDSGDPEKLAEVERKQQEIFDYYGKRH